MMKQILLLMLSVIWEVSGNRSPLNATHPRIRIVEATGKSEERSSSQLFVVAYKSSLVLSCSHNQFNSTLRWYYIDYSGTEEEIKESEISVHTDYNLTRSFLNLSDVNYEDSGWYECRRTGTKKSKKVNVLVTNTRSFPRKGEIYPRNDILINVGNRTSLACIIYNKIIQTSDAVVWKHRLFGASSSDYHDVTHLSTNLDGHTSLLTLSNITWEDRGSYTCSLKGAAESSIGMLNMRVGSNPAPSTDFQCVFYNYERVECSWNPGNIPHVETRHSLWFLKIRRTRKGFVPAYGKWEKCKKISVQCPFNDTIGHLMGRNDNCTAEDNSTFYCTLSYGVGKELGAVIQPIFYMRVNSTNPFGTALSKNLLIKLNAENAKMPPPDVFEVQNKSSSWVTVLVQYTKLAATARVNCHISVAKTGGSNEQENQTSSKSVNFRGFEPWMQLKFDDLDPFNSYSLKAACKSIDSKYHREETNTTFRTTSAVPLTGPKVTAGGFHTSGMLASGRRTVQVYWQEAPVSLTRGPVEGYEVQVINSTGDILLETLVNATKQNKVNFVTHANEVVDIRIRTINDVGTSADASVVTIATEAQLLPPPTFPNFTLLNDCPTDKVLLTWETSVEVTRNATSTIYWCGVSVNSNACIDNLQWIQGPPAINGSYTGDILSACNVKIGLSIDDTDGRTTGIHWFEDKAFVKTDMAEQAHRETYIIIVAMGSTSFFIVIILIIIFAQMKRIRESFCNVADFPDDNMLNQQSIDQQAQYSSVEYIPNFVNITSLLPEKPADARQNAEHRFLNNVIGEQGTVGNLDDKSLNSTKTATSQQENISLLRAILATIWKPKKRNMKPILASSDRKVCMINNLQYVSSDIIDASLKSENANATSVSVHKLPPLDESKKLSHLTAHGSLSSRKPLLSTSESDTTETDLNVTVRSSFQSSEGYGTGTSYVEHRPYATLDLNEEEEEEVEPEDVVSEKTKDFQAIGHGLFFADANDQADACKSDNLEAAVNEQNDENSSSEDKLSCKFSDYATNRSQADYVTEQEVAQWQKHTNADKELDFTG